MRTRRKHEDEGSCSECRYATQKGRKGERWCICARHPKWVDVPDMNAHGCGEFDKETDGERAVYNVEVCMRVGGEDPIVICSACHNEVEGTVLGMYADDAIYSYDVSPMPLYDYCPWCSAPLREDVR